MTGLIGPSTEEFLTVGKCHCKNFAFQNWKDCAIFKGTGTLGKSLKVPESIFAPVKLG